MSSTDTGRKAETAAANYLELRGFKIIEQNFKRTRGEIDIIAQKGGVIHLIEVKYRRNDNQGGGLDAITPTKLRQMRYAAEIWADEYKWQGEMILSAIEVTGPTYAVISFVENVL